MKGLTVAIKQPNRSQVLHDASRDRREGGGGISETFPGTNGTYDAPQACKVRSLLRVHQYTGRSYGKVVIKFEVNDMSSRFQRRSRSSRDSTVGVDPNPADQLPNQFPTMRARSPQKGVRVAAIAMAVLMWPMLALAQQSPWERAASQLEFTFTGPLARSLALVAIVIGGLMFMFGEGGAKRQISGIVFGGGLALFAGQFMTWLF